MTGGATARLLERERELLTLAGRARSAGKEKLQSRALNAAQRTTRTLLMLRDLRSEIAELVQ